MNFLGYLLSESTELRLELDKRIESFTSQLERYGVFWVLVVIVNAGEQTHSLSSTSTIPENGGTSQISK